MICKECWMHYDTDVVITCACGKEVCAQCAEKHTTPSEVDEVMENLKRELGLN